MIYTKDDERIDRLQSIPGVGPITALMMVAVVDEVSRFKNSKLFAAYLGLVPKVSASREYEDDGIDHKVRKWNVTKIFDPWCAGLDEVLSERRCEQDMGREDQRSSRYE